MVKLINKSVILVTKTDYVNMVNMINVRVAVFNGDISESSYRNIGKEFQLFLGRTFHEKSRAFFSLYWNKCLRLRLRDITEENLKLSSQRKRSHSKSKS